MAAAGDDERWKSEAAKVGNPPQARPNISSPPPSLEIIRAVLQLITKIRLWIGVKTKEVLLAVQLSKHGLPPGREPSPLRELGSNLLLNQRPTNSTNSKLFRLPLLPPHSHLSLPLPLLHLLPPPPSPLTSSP